MGNIKVFHYDAFSHIPGMGNPAGVVLDSMDLTEEQMRQVAEQVGFNETAFPLKSDFADLRIRYFTPGHEINLCGHATMATVYALYSSGMLGDKMNFTIETKAGVLPIRLNLEQQQLFITMKQAAPEFHTFQGSIQELSNSIEIEVSDIDTDIPIVYGSTGTWTLLVPVRTLDAFRRMKPENNLFPSLLKEMPRASIHPFCLQTYDEAAHIHARHFSSPYSGTIEDPVTGTASGVLGAYYAKYIKNESATAFELLVEQGQELGKDGRVRVNVTSDGTIEITGSAVYVNEFHVLI
ncbi:PhzF family phenazine biosynthesis isomerase [Paenibacillus urinalis]|uniref:PhzF family phenazine biosynthesis isomerase n=1 Tax=Paenibacillus urinalis TaxID=521520 RepID=A0AAX3MUJ4_9BACL|nr:PhzF family phenazine biosynthesis isomerase [Paenibacillus urinalis]WDH80723.1 PhzF family phenazine biosynthesis isomerase [Paenibacillus urinalis]WDH96776.1 PhzF family phenazine biosynthesis isomerase [Paenibacillus urinalis]WDI00419.1 PhzF family phenazine biosynthesis isomerase [Paenibacillus urinalis]